MEHAGGNLFRPHTGNRSCRFSAARQLSRSGADARAPVRARASRSRATAAFPDSQETRRLTYPSLLFWPRSHLRAHSPTCVFPLREALQEPQITPEIPADTRSSIQREPRNRPKTPASIPIEALQKNEALTPPPTPLPLGGWHIRKRDYPAVSRYRSQLALDECKRR